MVVEVPESVAADSFDLLDQQVHRFGGAVADAAGGEVGQKLIPPGLDRGGQAAQLWNTGVGAVHEPFVEPCLGCGAAGRGVDPSEVLGRDPGEPDLLIDVAGVQAGQQPRPGMLAQVLGTAAKDAADGVERVVSPSSVSGGFLLDAAPDIIDGGEPEPDNVEGIQHPDRVGQACAQGGGVAPERVQSGHLDAQPPSRGLG